jgi:hypothetical protein
MLDMRQSAERRRPYVTTPDQSSDEQRIAERYLHVLNHLSRCADAVRNGDWDNLDTFARTLARSADQLADAVHEQLDPATSPHAAVVVDIVVERSGDCEVARLLHPHRPATTSRTGNTASIDPFAQPSR